MSHPPQNPNGAPQGQQPQQGAPQQPGNGAPQQTQGYHFPAGAGFGAGQQPNYSAQQPGYGAPQQPQQPRPNPFAGTPLSDWVRDGAAAILLLVSLALPWSFPVFGGSGDGFTTAASRVEVLLITLLSVLSIAIGYLAKFGVFGANMPAQKVALLRALVNVPYVLLVVLYIVFDAAKLGESGFLNIGGGLGPAAAIGLTGALIAASPRKQEVQSPGFAQTAAKFSYNAYLVFFALAAVTTVLGVVMTILYFADSGAFRGEAINTIGTFVTGVVPALLVPALLFVVVRRSGSTRVLALGIGYAALLALFIRAFSTGSDSPSTLFSVIESVHLTFGYPLLWLGASVGVLASPALAYAMQQPQQRMEFWHQATRIVPVAIMVTGGLITVTSVLQIIAAKGDDIGLAVGVLICAVLSVAAAAVLRIQITTNYQQGRLIISAIAGAIVVLGLVAAILQGVDDSALASLNLNFAWMIVGYFGSVGVLFYALFSPKEVRDYFASLQPQMPAQGQYATGAYDQNQFAAQQGQQPGQPQPGQPQPGQQFDQNQYATGAYTGVVQGGEPADPQQAQQQAQAQQHAPSVPQPGQAQDQAARASDPSTPAQELHAMTQQRELWPHLAANPGLYPALEQWLASTGDPATLEALRKRGVGSSTATPSDNASGGSDESN